MTTKVESFVDMQFSNKNIFAAAALYGNKPSPSWMMAPTFNDPRVKALSKKVKIESHPRTEELFTNKIKSGKYPLFWDTLVEISTKDGNSYNLEINAPKGTPANPLTESEVIEKFRTNASYSPLFSRKVDAIIEVVDKLEKLADTTELTNLLTVA
jgi:2-methylcitrate dehydratase PrpD